ncbi:hypothetical protein M405DRAFT_190751 [Rhizopogon salebrosus TDB-379]|nr:hypothetical protein M405DRAFT_190751 [Rhizopogon salebrosus TDB-379]
MMNALPIHMLLSPAASPFCLRALLCLALSVVACYPPIASARPTGELLRRQSSSGVSSSGDGVSANVWLPILIVAIVFAVLTLIACIRRYTYRGTAAGTAASSTQNQPAGQVPTARPGRRRRPARTPSQISTKSLPPYMKEPGDHELVIFKGSDMEDEPHDSLPASIQNAAPGDRRSKFSFLFNPFGGSSRHPPVSIYNRAVTPDRHGSSLSLASVNSGHRRNRGASDSVSGLLGASNDHAKPISSPSTISVDSISAPLTYTLKRSEFRAPKGGLTPEQIKLITSRGALERFGAPYGPDAVAFSASRSNMVPPPDFEATISNSLGHVNRSSIDLQNTFSTGGPSRETDSVISATSISPSKSEGDLQSSSSSRSPSSSYHQPQAESRTSSVVSFETAASRLSPPATPLTARPVTPVTARPLSH